jgi:hypothetical protein
MLVDHHELGGTASVNQVRPAAQRVERNAKPRTFAMPLALWQAATTAIVLCLI